VHQPIVVLYVQCRSDIPQDALQGQMENPFHLDFHLLLDSFSAVTGLVQ
jgi:hypothetical protein